MKLFTSLFLHSRFFFCIAGISVFFVFGFFIPILFIISKMLLFILLGLTVIDLILLFSKNKGVEVTRFLPEKLSNGDINQIKLIITNNYNFIIVLEIIEELPFQFQKRDFIFTEKFKVKEVKDLCYDLKPVSRGLYNFGNSNVYVTSLLKLGVKKYVLAQQKSVKCYPSFLQFTSFSTKAFSNSLSLIGNKKVRRIGNSLEFEQIKDYVSGDDIRTLNWKATAKTGRLMVNQFIEEKSQSVYCVIDKGRVMQMSFDGLTLLDYAINSTLALSNIILRKQDKAGMLTFSKNIEDAILAEQRNSQIQLISDALYNLQTNFLESDFSKLYATVKRKITQRSLLILFTNFETLDGLHRQLPYLRALAKNHLLIVVFFKNTVLQKISDIKAKNKRDVYDKIIAEKFIYEKEVIVNELKKYGIQSVLTEPSKLTNQTIEKYLDVKSRGIF